MGFRHPSAHARYRGPPAAPGAARRYVPSSGFGYPLDGFLPRCPGRLCFAPTALLGFALRSVTPHEVPAALPPPLTHLPFLPSATRTDRQRSDAVTPGRGSWALFLARPPISGGRLSTANQSRELPWALPLPGFCQRKPSPRRTSSHTLRNRIRINGSRRPRVSISFRLAASGSHGHGFRTQQPS
jgi:hypothetical protein